MSDTEWRQKVVEQLTRVEVSQEYLAKALKEYAEEAEKRQAKCLEACNNRTTKLEKCIFGYNGSAGLLDTVRSLNTNWNGRWAAFIAGITLVVSLVMTVSVQTFIRKVLHW